MASIFGSRALLSIAAAQLLAVAAFADTTESRDLANFDAIEVGGNVDLVIRQGRNFVVEVSADDAEDLERLITEVENGTLRIYQEQEPGGWFRFGWFQDQGGADVVVTLPELRRLRTSGGSDTTSDGDLAGELLEVRASGGSDVRIDVDVEQLVVRTSGGADATFMGRVGALEARSSGGSDIEASKLTAREATLRSSGGSDMIVAVTDRLVARASGGSDIIYSGNPAETDIDESGGSDIVPR